MDIVVIRQTNGHLIMSKPCKHCILYLKNIGIKRVYYSDNNGNLVCEKVKDMCSEHQSSIHKIK
jgi:deoxycytidylate deaminase